MKLAEFLTEELIELQVEAENWEEAIKTAGQLLVENNFCQPRYVAAMINAVHDMGPYMVLAPGIALAHARPEDGMLNAGMSLINLAEPVNFGSEANDPVSLVIAFGGANDQSHVQMLQELAKFLMDEENQALLKTATSKSKLLEAFAGA
jgi:mannitol/fructose-specific phosphotransferase system IIA component (Ntr-type)